MSSKLEKQVKILKSQPEIGLIYTDVIEVNDKSKKLKKRYGVKDISGDPIKTLLLHQTILLISLRNLIWLGS